LFKKKLSLRNDFIVTFFNGLATVFGVFIISGIIARNFGLDELGEFLLIRRIITTSVGIILIGSNITLPSIFPRNQDTSYISISLISFFFLSIPIILIISFLLNGFINTSTSFLPYLLYILGFSIVTLAYALYRSQMNILGANILQLFSLTFVSLICVLIATSIQNLFMLMGIFMIGLGSISFYIGIRKINFNKINQEKISTFFYFGLVRTPGIFFQFFLIAGVPIISIFYLSLVNQAYLNVGISLVRIFLIIVGPLGIILLPRIAKDLNSYKDNFSNKENLSIMLKTTFYYSSISTFVLILINNQVLQVWLGSYTNETNINISILLSSVPFFILSSVLRSPIDALSNYGYNSIIYGIAVIMMIFTFYFLMILNTPPFFAGSISFCIGNFMSGIFSVYFIKKLIKIDFLDFKSIIELLLILSFLYLIIEFIKQNFNFILIILFSISSLLIIIYFHFSFSKLKWVVSLRKLIFKK